MNTKFDWVDIERQYVTGKMGLRELAAANGVSNHSLVTRRSTRDEWARKREEFQAKAEARALQIMGTEEGARIARESHIRDDALDLISKTIQRLSDDLDRTQKVLQGDGTVITVPLVPVTVKDVASLIDRFQVLFGKPSSISEERNLGVHFNSDNPDLLRAIVEATRGVAAVGSGGSPLPRIEDPLPH